MCVARVCVAKRSRYSFLRVIVVVVGSWYRLDNIKRAVNFDIPIKKSPLLLSENFGIAKFYIVIV